MNVKEADLLSRDEMRNIMAGSGGSGSCGCTVDCGSYILACGDAGAPGVCQSYPDYGELMCCNGTYYSC